MKNLESEFSKFHNVLNFRCVSTQRTTRSRPTCQAVLVTDGSHADAVKE